MVERRKVQIYPLIAIALVSCSMLMYEILLTRISALRLIFHFSFLVVSNCLLGIGASGTFIALYQDRFRGRPRFWIALFSCLYLVSLVITYAFLINFNIRADINDPFSRESLQFILYMLFGAFPFFFGGCVVGLVLMAYAELANVYYAADLVGGGIGCFLFPLLLMEFGAGGGFLVLMLIPMVSLLLLREARRRRMWAGIIVGLLIGGAFLVPRFDRLFPVPGKGNLDLTSEFTADLAREILEYSRWSSISRIDMLRMKPEHRIMFCLGTKEHDIELPEEKLIVQDCSAGTLILNFGEHPESLRILDRSTYVASMKLKSEPRVFIIGAGGGNDVWAAQRYGASKVRAIELNRQILDIHYEVLPEFSRPLLEDPRIEMIHDEGRSAMMRDKQTYDIVQMTGIDTYTALTSGAYMLAENYLYTVEAFESMFEHVAEDGILQITRQAADMETIRLLGNMYAALDEEMRSHFAESVICLMTNEPLITTMLKRGVYTEDEIATIESYTDEAGIGIVYLPGRELGNEVEEFIRTEDKQAFIEAYPRNIAPTTDDKPYFFNFSRWRNPWRAKSFIREPTHVSQGNPLFILIQLAISSMLAFILIVVPVIVSGRVGIDRKHLGRFLIYFSALGAGFICIEITMFQKLTLFLGHPSRSLTVTLFAMLFFTGLGSLMTTTWLPRGRGAYWSIPVALLALVGAFVWLTPVMVRNWIGLELPARIGITVATIAPIAMLLGVPFAFGIRLVNRLNPTLVPLGWAINGLATVVGSILSVILSMNMGFNFVLFASVAVYFAGFYSIRRLAWTP